MHNITGSCLFVCFKKYSLYLHMLKLKWINIGFQVNKLSLRRRKDFISLTCQYVHLNFYLYISSWLNLRLPLWCEFSNLWKKGFLSSQFLVSRTNCTLLSVNKTTHQIFLFYYYRWSMNLHFLLWNHSAVCHCLGQSNVHGWIRWKRYMKLKRVPRVPNCGSFLSLWKLFEILSLLWVLKTKKLPYGCIKL